MISFALGLAFGLTLWTLLEYGLHRFVFHRRIFGALAAKEHILHHAQVGYFAHWSMKVALAIPILSVIIGGATLLVGWRLGVSVPIGVLSGYGFYEIVHRRIHVAAPLGAYGRWARRHHLLHHFGKSDRNHGVTSPIWDVVFGTLAARETVRVPRQHAPKFPWLFDAENNAIRTAFAADYRIG
jgi:sterol desaturase/sphingolipid hydroxylase (fatty acid hydroxylase superfamily)